VTIESLVCLKFEGSNLIQGFYFLTIDLNMTCMRHEIV